MGIAREDGLGRNQAVGTVGQAALLETVVERTPDAAASARGPA
jgi:hypothetical protein